MPVYIVDNSIFPDLPVCKHDSKEESFASTLFKFMGKHELVLISGIYSQHHLC